MNLIILLNHISNNLYIKVGLCGMTVTMLLFLLGTKKCKFVVVQMSRSPIRQIILCITDHIFFGASK